ncbi:PRD domain-containing protein [Ligilactobacillus sp. WILCCON 0076]|uniref:PRD domain-containing protein n=1 Tax=Ligilactobacillus ubinensis TaxID=2876789 RepID=A0A9X2FLE3_9LACO|nr:PRD domain-containing protein [Ligilactobacillus ubinensis]MCP0886673.1 PRD domain-containing protein [Ligilactobacillus ubinensis]
MKVIKKINNNVAVCLDNNEEELVAFGKGIGFPKIPYVLNDMSKIEITFYRLNSQKLLLLKEIPEDVVEISTEIVKLAQRRITKRLNPNIIFGLADHINFALIRQQKYKDIKLPFAYDIKELYPTEYELGIQAVKLIRNKINPNFSSDEAIAIATHFINSQENGEPSDLNRVVSSIIKETTIIIEEHFKIKINEQGFSYNRFSIHLRYYIKRIQENKQIEDGASEDLLNTFRKNDFSIYKCTMDIVTMIDEKLNSISSNDEMFYLMIYVKRMISKTE